MGKNNIELFTILAIAVVCFCSNYLRDKSRILLTLTATAALHYQHVTNQAESLTWLQQPIRLIKNLLQGPLCIFNEEGAFRILPDVLFMVLEYKWHVMNVGCVCRHTCWKPCGLCKSNTCALFATFDSALCIFANVPFCARPGQRLYEVDRTQWRMGLHARYIFTTVGFSSFKIVSYSTGSTNHSTCQAVFECWFSFDTTPLFQNVQSSKSMSAL